MKKIIMLSIFLIAFGMLSACDLLDNVKRGVSQVVQQIQKSVRR